MDILQYSKKNFYLFLMFFILNFGLSNNNYTMTIHINDKELSIFNINQTLNKDTNCGQWIPSLYNPFMLSIDSNYDQKTEKKDISAYVPTLSLTEKLDVEVFFSSFLEIPNVTIGVVRFPTNVEDLDGNCYLGLSNKIGNFSLGNDSILINKLEKQGIYRKIFSFDEWKINKDDIKLNFYLGYERDIFKPKKDNDGIIGECDVNKDYEYWGCSFSDMIINNITLNLTKSNGELYKIYFSSENYNIIFPKSFFENFNDSTKGICTYDPKHQKSDDFYLSCKEDLFNNESYISLKLISEDMEITIEIDNKNKFRNGNFDKKNMTRIRFEPDSDDFILPLIMFKKFHIQFDAENNKIQFYTTNSDILKNKKKKKEEKKSSNASIVFLIIFIIILVAVLSFGVFWFIKKRKGSIEKNINKYNKFDEDDNFKNLNEQRVF